VVIATGNLAIFMADKNYPMRHISILVPETSVIEAIADPRYLFTTVNQFLEAAGRAPQFDVELVGASKEVKLNKSLFSVHVDRLFQDVKKTANTTVEVHRAETEADHDVKSVDR